jgi:thioredoxin reductase
MQRTELAIIGGGCAGLCAAIEAARAGVDVTVIDEHARAGGQLFKQIHKFFGSQAHMAGVRGYDIAESLLGECQTLGVRVLLSTVAYGIFPERLVGIATPTHVDELRAERILIAAGASENPLAFPGWTLPGVMGAGAAQTLMNLYRVLPGRRVLIVGAGNVGLIVGFQLLQAGAEVVALVEAMDRVTGYMIHAAKLTRTGVPILLRHTIAEASGSGEVERAIVEPIGEAHGETLALDVDCICIAVGLSPLVELAQMAECRIAYLPELGGHVPLHDENMETSVPGVYVAGDVAGVEEVNTAMDEGRLAGVAAAESLGKMKPSEAAERKERIRERLAGLRLGPFGEHRHRDKRKLAAMLQSLR